MDRAQHSRLATLGYPLVVGLVYFAAAYVSLRLTLNVEGLATIWPPSGILVAALLLGRRHWWSVAIVVPFASVPANWLVGTSFSHAVGFTIANLCEAYLVAWLYSRVARGGEITEMISAAKFAFHAVLGALASAAIATAWTGKWHWSFFGSWFVTVLMGMLIVTPLIMSVARAPAGDEWINPRRMLGALALMGVVLGATLLAISVEHFYLIFLPFAPMLLATYRLGSFGSAASVATVALVGSLAIAWRIGPFSTVDANPTVLMYAYQFYLLMLLASSMPLAVLLMQHSVTLDRLEESHGWLEMAERAAQVGHWRINMKDESIFWSNEIYRMHGVPLSVTPTRSLLSGLSHPDDARHVDRVVGKAIADGESFTLVSRIIRPDGEVRYLESNAHPETDQSGRVVAIFGTFQDVTDKIEVLQQLEQAQHSAVLDAQRSREIAETDQLTGVASRRKIISLLAEALEAAETGEEELTIAMLDIDHFKSINDRYGHLVGDEVLVKIAGSVRTALRRKDRCGRMGGEEFLIIMHDTGRIEAADIIERVRNVVASLEWKDIPDLRATVSLGIATYRPGADESWMLQAADQALYDAKRSGRNCLRFAA